MCTICNFLSFIYVEELADIVHFSLCLLPQASFPPVETITASTTPPVTVTQEAVFVCLVSLDGTARSSLVGVPCSLNVVPNIILLTHVVPVKAFLPLLPIILASYTVGIAICVYFSLQTLSPFLSTPACSCENGGSCIFNSNSSICACPPGYTGQYCQDVSCKYII